MARETKSRFTDPAVDYPTEEDDIRDVVSADEIEAVPVFLVDDSTARDTIRWNGTTVMVNSERPVQLAGARPNRTRLIVTNITDLVTVFMSHDSQVSAGFGYSLVSDSPVEMLHNGNVWAIAEPGESANVNVLTEYVVDDE